MPALNFQSRWADAVELGALHANNERVIDECVVIPKRTTIRRPGRAEPGDTLYLYTGQRTKECRKLGEALCLFVTSISVWRDATDQYVFNLGGKRLNTDAANTLARLDTAGQWSAAQLVRFFEELYDLPFKGELIGW